MIAKALGSWKKTNDALAAVAGGIIFIISIWNTANVIARLWGVTALGASLEGSQLLLAFAAFLPVVYAQFEGLHIRVMVLSDKFQPTVKSAFEYLWYIASSFIALLIGLRLLEFALISWRFRVTTESFLLPIYPSKMMMAIMFLIFAVHLFVCIGIKYMVDRGMLGKEWSAK